MADAKVTSSLRVAQVIGRRLPSVRVLGWYLRVSRLWKLK